METITKPMALDESFNTTESTSRNQADVLAGIESAIRQGFGQVASAVEYDHTDSGLTADNVQDAIDEVDDTVDGLVDDVAEISNDIESTKTASGNPITLTDAAPINAESLVVELEPKQDLHGQSAPYVGGAGKNKLPMTVDGIKAENIEGTWSGNAYTINGVTYTILTDDGGNVIGINVNGTNNQSSTASLWICDYAEIPDQCIVNGGAVGGGIDSAYAQINKKPIGGGTASIEGYLYTDQNTLNLSDTSYSYTYIIYVLSGKTANNLLFLPMIRLSTETDPTFAPYSNICPITGYTECEVNDVGKNLFDYTQFLNADGWTESNGIYSGVISDLYAYSGYGSAIPVHPDWEANTVYTLSLYNVACTGLARFRVQYTDGTFDDLVVYSDSVGNYISITTAENKTVDNLLFTYNNGGDLSFKEFQIEKSASRTQFQPYSSTSATIQFGQTVYGGSVDFLAGVLTVTHKCVDMGDMVWYKQTSVGSDVAASSSLVSEIAVYEHDEINFKCSEYTPSDLYVWHVNGNITIGNVFAPKHVNVCNSDFVNKTNEEIQTMLQGVQLWYELETPFTIQLTPTDLKLLKGINNLTTNGTTINLGYQPDNVIGDVKGEIEKCAVDAEFMQFTDGTDTFTDVNLSLDAFLHTVSVVGSKIEQKRFICFEVMDKMGGVLQGILASCIAFTDGAKTPSGTAFRAYIESLQMYVTFRIYGSGGSYTLAYQSETSFSASAFFVRVRMMNNL